MSRRDYYQVLGVTQDASHADIRAAFVRLSKRHHPDLAGSDGLLPWRLHDLQEAYHCLSDAASRAVHDRGLAEDRRLHFAQQRTIQRRLYRYDLRHPHGTSYTYRLKRRGVVLAFVILVAIALETSFRLFG